jgi:hypothetical protein
MRMRQEPGEHHVPTGPMVSMFDLLRRPFDMPRPRQRVCLQAGLKLNLNSRARFAAA